MNELVKETINNFRISLASYSYSVSDYDYETLEKIICLNYWNDNVDYWNGYREDF